MSGTGRERWNWQKIELEIPHVVAKSLIELASEAEHEICGFIVDSDRIVPVDNIAEDTSHAWRMDYDQMLYCIREYGERVGYIYHSHPNGRDWPSAQDEDGIAYLYKQGCPWGYLIVTSDSVTQYSYCKDGAD